MNKKIKKIMITISVVIAISLGIVYAGLIVGSFDRTVDYTPPNGRIEIVGAEESGGINYVDSTTISVKLFAEDDKSSADEIKYYLSTSPITEVVEDSAWKIYYEGVVETIEMQDPTAITTIYVAFKDADGNTSTIFANDSKSYTITYDANGGVNPPAAQTAAYGMFITIPMQKPTYEGKMFVGWSDVKGSKLSDYDNYEIFKQGDSISSASLAEGNQNKTLYAVWTENISELPKLADMVNIGDYVDYPVYYENIATAKYYQNTKTEYITNLKGWRVLSKEDDGTVNLISAGVPLSYMNEGNAQKCIMDLAINLLNTPFSDSDVFTFRKNGFTPFMTLEEVFNNEYTATYNEDTIVSYTSTYDNGTSVTYSGEKKAGELKVRSFTKEELDKIYDPTGATIAKRRKWCNKPKMGRFISYTSKRGSGAICTILSCFSI